MRNSVKDSRQYAPATERNKHVILQVLQQVLPDSGTVLEIASGTGEHSIFFAPHLAPRCWIPSDPNPLARASINAWQQCYPCEGLCKAIALDVCEDCWPIENVRNQEQLLEQLQEIDHAIDIDLEEHPIRAIVNINMIHISPWSACRGLMAGAGRILPPEGILYLYGPFKENGEHTAPSNAAFDESLRSQNPDWGIRDLDEVIAEAEKNALRHHATLHMPANNLSVVFQKD
ncbi:MAG: DUF938 domain-containing protein [Leptolyngbyaceae bacterium]|nr:DUF938 domain-containing protein [Leptolyngbyaceae bacterium]